MRKIDMRSKWRLIMIVCAFVLSSSAITCAKNKGVDNKPSDFSLPDLTGKNVSLSEYLGKDVILLVFGTTKCRYCEEEIPELKEIYDGFKEKEFVLLYIYIGESGKRVSAYAKENKLPYTVLLDERGEVPYAYGVIGTPYAVLIDKKSGIVLKGPVPEGVLSGKIEELLR